MFSLGGSRFGDVGWLHTIIFLSGIFSLLLITLVDLHTHTISEGELDVGREEERRRKGRKPRGKLGKNLIQGAETGTSEVPKP